MWLGIFIYIHKHVYLYTYIRLIDSEAAIQECSLKHLCLYDLLYRDFARILQTILRYIFFIFSTLGAAILQKHLPVAVLRDSKLCH